MGEIDEASIADLRSPTIAEYDVTNYDSNIGTSTGNGDSDIKWAILKSTRVHPSALVKILTNHIQESNSETMKAEIRKLIRFVEDTKPDGETRVFVCCSRNTFSFHQENVCFAVRQYRRGKELLSDFCLSTFSNVCWNGTDVAKKTLCAVTAGVAAGSLVNKIDTITNGMGSIICAGIAVGMTSWLQSSVGSSGQKQDAESERFRNELKTDFERQLISRRFATLQNGQMTLTSD